MTNKQNSRGLGSRSAKERQADQWWLNAFDAALRQANTSDGKDNGVNDGPSALERVVEFGVGKGGLYGWFRRGEVMSSTFEEPESDASSGKRKRETKADSKASRRKISDGSDDVAASVISAKKRKKERQLRADQHETTLPMPVSTTGNLSSVRPIDNSKERMKLQIKAELKRRKRAGEFVAPLSMSSEDQKKHSKQLKRDAKRRIKDFYKSEQLNGDVQDLCIVSHGKSLVQTHNEPSIDDGKEQRRNESCERKRDGAQKSKRMRLEKESKLPIT